MSFLTAQFLQDIGIELTDDQATALSEHFDNTLYEKVIDSVIRSLNDEQIEDLLALKSAPNDLMQSWLASNVSDLETIIEQEVENLLYELEPLSR